MKINQFSMASLGLILGSMLSADLAAHTTVLPKNSPDEFYTRNEPDGASSVVNDFSIPHGCDGENVIATSMLFPNGMDVVVEDQDGNAIDSAVLFDALEEDNNVVMGMSPALDANWKFQEVLKGPVNQYNNHGLKDTDARAFVYKGGSLPDGFMALLKWRASFANIKNDSCVSKIEVRIPIVNYCGRNPASPSRMDAWIGRLTDKFSDPALVSEGFWPQITIVNTDMDESCGDGTVLKVSPSDMDIDHFLPIQSFKP